MQALLRSVYSNGRQRRPVRYSLGQFGFLWSGDICLVGVAAKLGCEGDLHEDQGGDRVQSN